MNRRRGDRWSRVFVLLIFVMAAVVAAERIVERSREGMGDSSFASTVTVPVAPTATIIPSSGEDYPFLPPTAPPQTPTQTPAPVLTPTPPAPLVEISISDEQNSTQAVSPRATPMGAVSGVIARCPVPGKQVQYFFYDLASGRYRSLSESFDYLASSLEPGDLAYATDAIQHGLSVEEFASFPFPEQWLLDQNFSVLGVSIDHQSMLVQRFGRISPGIFWLNRVTQENRQILDWNGTLSEVQAVPQLDAVMLQYPDEDHIDNLYLVYLVDGMVDWLTQYEFLGARNGRISPNGRRLAYWTTEGVWLVSLDGTFANLAFPGASHPVWAPDSSRLAVVHEGELKISNLEGTQLTSIGGGIIGGYSKWLPGGASLVYWRKDGNVCEWRVVNVETTRDTSLLRANNSLCQPAGEFTFSNDGLWLLGVIPASTVKNDQSGAVSCNLQNGSCQFLADISGYTCDQAVWAEQVLPYTWEFTTDTDGWWLIQQIRSQGVTDGIWSLTSQGSFPVISSPSNLGVNADLYTMLEITLRVDAGSEATLYITTDADREYNDRKSFQFSLIADGDFHRYRFNLGAWSEWTGVVNGLRLRLSDQNNTQIDLDQVHLYAVNN